MEKGVSNSSVRQENRRKLMKLLYWSRGISKQDISIGMRLSMPTVNLLVTQLAEDGLIEKRRADASSGGRIPDLLYFKYDAKLAVGVEILTNSCTILIADLAGNCIARKSVIARFNDGVTYWQGLRALILQTAQTCNFRPKDILGVGIALHQGVENYGNVTGLRPGGLSRFSKLDSLLGLPVLVERDANAAGFANVWFGRPLRDAVYLSVSEEVSGAIITNQRVLHGMDGRSGEFGHMTLVTSGERCACGRYGCAQLYCSTDVLKRAGGGTLEDFFDLMPKSVAAGKAWMVYADRLAALITNINIMTDLPVMLGGELGQFIDLFEPDLEQRIESQNPFYTSKVLCRATAVKDAAATGAALMVTARNLNLLDEPAESL